MGRTLDLLQQAKDKLMAALREAEREAPPSIVRKLDKLAGDCEALQAKVSAEIANKGLRLR